MIKIKLDSISSYNMGLLRQLSKDLIGDKLVIESDKEVYDKINAGYYTEIIKVTKTKITYIFTNRN